MSKTILGVIAVIVLLAGGYYFMGSKIAPTSDQGTSPQKTQVDQVPNTQSAQNRVVAGSYTVDPAQSVFKWAGKKPLIDGYVNSGTIAVSAGTVSVGENTASGNFTLDMNTLDVGLTAKKPGQEGALEGHLKGERFFNVAQFPTATFVITKVAPLDEAQDRYTVTGNLTMKGATHEINFPATIYLEGETLVATADTEIDRTKWGITAGSKNFFENLGDNIIDDMVAISFTIRAPKTP